MIINGVRSVCPSLSAIFSRFIQLDSKEQRLEIVIRVFPLC